MTKDFGTDEISRIQSLFQLARSADKGQQGNLECPECHKSTVSVWFSNPVPNEYRTWFICAECSFHTRAQCTDRPTFFSPERCRPDLEARDKAILDAAKFKRPTC
jgi:hypothetical protein